MPYVQSPTTEELPATAPATTPAPAAKRPFLRWAKIPPAFWTVASIFSLVVNIILILVIVVLGQQLFTLKHLVEDNLLGGLYQNFVLMDQAHIRTTIPVSTEVPAKFDLALNTNTTVVLTEDTTIKNTAIRNLNAGPLQISQAIASITLPAGTQLPVQLNLTVPVDQKIPVSLNVGVDIPLSQTELHQPFVGLQEVVKPYYTLLKELPNNWQDAICGPEPSDTCLWLVPQN